MKSLEEEAEEYFPLLDTTNDRKGEVEEENLQLLGHRKSFIAGASSKWVQVEKIKVQIDENDSILQMLFLHGNEGSRIRVVERIESLNQQLKDLENENT
jgi:hypothetical protein